ncbi:MAG: HEPN domain-containing protein [Petrimonas sp.]|nr:HEPN domain-containing protein [Petrimonas sp.]
MAREGFNNAAVNRLYYACYYAVSALLLSQKVQSHTHAGTKTMFALHIISPGKMPIEIASVYFTLFEKRHTGDYDDFVLFQDSTVQELTKQAITFIESVGNLLPKNNLT